MYHGNKAESCHGVNGSAEKFGEYSCEAGKDLFISSVKGLNQTSVLLSVHTHITQCEFNAHKLILSFNLPKYISKEN